MGPPSCSKQDTLTCNRTCEKEKNVLKNECPRIHESRSVLRSLKDLFSCNWDFKLIDKYVMKDSSPRDAKYIAPSCDIENGELPRDAGDPVLCNVSALCTVCVCRHSLTCKVVKRQMRSRQRDLKACPCDRCSGSGGSDSASCEVCVTKDTGWKDDDWRSNWRRRRRGTASWWVLLLLLLLAPLVSPGELRANKDISKERSEGVCQSVDVRNTVEAFSRLSGCRVVEGFVQIVLIDHATENSFTNLSFPELREITHYLLLYRVNGLRSLGKLFPNLAVIRGETLFLNYALVAFEMIHLQELGLYSLTDILRGSVRIEKNPLLCFVDTVDWDLIAKNGRGEHFITGNRNPNECPMCPSEQLQCPNSSKLGPLCWNRQKCQKVCPEKCGNSSCMPNGECCHVSCLGGCMGDTAEDCMVCRDVVIQNLCIQKCPSDTYKYLNRRCILENECRNMSRPRERSYDLRSKPYKPFNNSCVLECPNGFVEIESEPNKYNCTPCQGRCRRECPGANIDSIAAAQKMRGCTYVRGALEIQIRGGKNVVKELEENLNMLEEIEEYLKIVRSFPLISLNFLQKLKVIHGRKLDSNKYAFVLLDNQNLQELWDWNFPTDGLRILNGRLFFHFNPKLCLYKIEKLKEVAQLPNFTDLEVASNSNGDKVACNVTMLHARVTKIQDSGAIVGWEHFEHYDPRTLLGYVVYYIEAPYQNLTLYDGRDACGGDGWHMEDVPVTQNITILPHLKPYTQYAFYVKTYTIATERTGAQSPIHYFRTLPFAPTPPMSLTVSSNSSSELVLHWQAPLNPNGNVTHYVIIGTGIKDDQIVLDQRNYCQEPLIQDKKPIHIVPDKSTEKKEDDDKCVCEDKSSKVPKVKETDVQAQIHFEDSLHNLLYIKRPSQSRRKRDASWQDTTLGVRSMVSPRLVEPSELGDPDYISTTRRYVETTEENTQVQEPQEAVSSVQSDQNFKHVVYGATQFVVRNLSHFTEYTVSVEACRETVPEELSFSSVKNCSRKNFVMVRTLQLVGADNVDGSRLVLEVLNESLGMVKLKWEEPPSPNGIIVTYQIEYTRVDIPNYKPTVECITRSQFLNFSKSYTLMKLHPGNYSLRLRATSLAGSGEYTRPKYFIIKETSSSSMEFLVGALVGTAIVTAVLCLVVIYLKRRYSKGDPNLTIFASVNPDYKMYTPDEWEVSRDKVELLRELGQGSFGMVYEGIVCNVVDGHPEMHCAVKTMNEPADSRQQISFLCEASVMKAFNTHHVVRLLGVVSQGQPVLVIMELMANGDLKSFLRSHRPDVSEDPRKQPPSLKRILQMAVEIADGMAYLAAKKFVHRDLAARNCMVAEDLTVKIGDFGMTRDIYETDYYRKGTKGLLPVRWMAPESLKDGVFTSSSDVWSYGVVLWEMATLASQPYQGLSNDQVLRYVIDGGVMERPENCPDRLYQLMRLCWQHKPSSRPPFLELVELLLPDVSPSFANVSFYHSEEGQELCAPPRPELSDDPSTPLKISRDVEDFSLGEGSDDDDNVCPQTDLEVGFTPNYQSKSISRNRDILVSPSPNGKVSNGSAATSPTAANGWIVGRQSNGTSSANSTGSTGMTTTQC